MTLTIYTGALCAPCKALKRYLDYKGVAYTEKPTEEPANAQEALSISGVTMVPVVRIDDEVVVGYNLPRLAQLLDNK